MIVDRESARLSDLSDKAFDFCFGTILHRKAQWSSPDSREPGAIRHFIPQVATLSSHVDKTAVPYRAAVRRCH